MLDIRRLKVLYELSRHGTVAATAEALSFTPSAISQQLAALERETGAELLARAPGRVQLTAAGRRLAARAEQVLRLLDELEDELASDQREVTGIVRVAAFASAMPALVDAASSLLERHPALELDLLQLEAEQAASALRRGSADLVVTQRYGHVPREAPPGVLELPVADDPVVVVLPKGHALEGGAIRLIDLAAEQWAMPAAGTECGTAVRLACKAAGFEPQPQMEADDHEAQLAFVRAGLGIGLIPLLAVKPWHRSVSAWPLEGGSLHRRLQIVIRPSSQSRPAIRAAIDAVRDALVAALAPGERFAVNGHGALSTTA